MSKITQIIAFLELFTRNRFCVLYTCTLVSPGEDRGEDISEEARAGEMRGFLTQMELAEMIHIQKGEA